MRTTFVAGPFTTLRVALVVHSTREDLLGTYAALRGVADGSVAAFCYHQGVTHDGAIAELHFSRQDMQVGVVVHEALHAGLILARYLRLDLEDHSAEELLAEAVQCITGSALAVRRSLGAARRPAKSHRRSCGPSCA